MSHNGKPVQMNQNGKLVQIGQNDNRSKLLKTVVLAKIAWFSQKMLKTVCSGQNGFILAKAAQNSAFVWNGYSKLCVLAKIAKYLGKSCFKQWLWPK